MSFLSTSSDRLVRKTANNVNLITQRLRRIAMNKRTKVRLLCISWVNSFQCIKVDKNLPFSASNYLSEIVFQFHGKYFPKHNFSEMLLAQCWCFKQLVRLWNSQFRLPIQADHSSTWNRWMSHVNWSYRCGVENLCMWSSSTSVQRME